MEFPNSDCDDPNYILVPFVASAFLTLNGFDLDGDEIANQTGISSLGACGNLCTQTIGCVGFSYGIGGNENQICFMKKNIWSIKLNPNRTSGSLNGTQNSFGCNTFRIEVYFRYFDLFYRNWGLWFDRRKHQFDVRRKFFSLRLQLFSIDRVCWIFNGYWRRRSDWDLLVKEWIVVDSIKQQSGIRHFERLVRPENCLFRKIWHKKIAQSKLAIKQLQYIADIRSKLQ